MSQKIHFVGIGGSGISGVAHLAEKMGYIVSGCDLEESSAYGKNYIKGHSPDHITDSDLVVCSPSIFYQDSNNAEILAAKRAGKLTTWQEFLGKTLLKDKKVIAIAGTHGKSTTTAMAGKLLIDNGFDPVVIVGATVPEWGGNSRFGKGEYAVVEADEFNNNFLNYHPDIAIINNIEFDHPDFFKDENEVRSSFDKFIGNMVGRKILITDKDNLNKKFNLKLFGEHNQKNANMVYLLGRKLGISDEDIVRSIESFNGIGRRMELIADRSGVKVYDDYAHHPTAIKTTLEGVKQKYPDKKILVIDEPHGYKRTKALLPEYKGVFDSADKVIIGPIFKARDEVDPSVTPQAVAAASAHPNAIGLNTFEEIIENCKLEIENSNYEVIVVMGAGKSYLWAREIAKLLPVNFSDLTTFRTGGKIKKYFEVKNLEEIKSAVNFAETNNLGIFILGGGSDILVADREYDGVVIKYIGDSISYIGDDTLTAETGLEWDKLVEYSVNNNLQGIECLSGIPGSVGAAPVQNIGAYGQEISETLVNLEAFDLGSGRLTTFSKDDCKFGYRESVFKSPEYWQKYLITKVTFKLNKNKKPSVLYDSLTSYLVDKKIKEPTLGQVRDAVLTIRKGKFENPKEIGNAGSFFKNPIIRKGEFLEFINKFPNARYYETEGHYKIFAGWLIEAAGWKGKIYKTAGVSASHALILINPKGDAKAKDIYDLSEKIISDIKNRFGIKLEREVQLINF